MTLLRLLTSVFARSVVHPALLTFYATLLLSTTCGAYMKRYLPLGEAELAHRFHQQQIPIEFEAGATANFGNALIRLEEHGRLLIKGRDRAGAEWSFEGHWDSFGGGFFTADLDNSGTLDLIFASSSGGVGLSPTMSIVTLMFDHDGRPIPCEMDGYFEIDKKGVKDLLDLDGDGRAELIRQAYDDGYWITSLYEAREGRWLLVKGTHGQRSFPLYTRFTNRPNQVPTLPTRGRNPIEDDLSNDSPLFSSKLRAVNWAKVAQSENPELTLSDETICRPVAWLATMTVILDTKSGRETATLSAPEETRRLLETIRDRNLSVHIMGRRRYPVTGDRPFKPTTCVPETVWATENQIKP